MAAMMLLKCECDSTDKMILLQIWKLSQTEKLAHKGLVSAVPEL